MNEQRAFKNNQHDWFSLWALFKLIEVQKKNTKKSKIELTPTL